MKNKIIFILVGIILFGILFYNLYNDFIKDNSYNKIESSIDLYGYTLSNTDTKLYEEKFEELEDILKFNNIDFESYAKIISELFVIDVFNLDNKVASTDIGGLEFIHSDLKDNFKENMGATLYKNIEVNLDGNRKQELPTVDSISVDNIFKTIYNYKNKEYESYIIDLSWKYKKDYGYQDKIKLTLINDNNKLYIVKGE